MAVDTPESGSQVENRIKVDVQRSAPDSNPYQSTHWLRSLIAGIAFRIYDFYRDLNRTEFRLMPDTASGDALARWGAILIGAQNTATGSGGNVIATGTATSVVPAGTVLTSSGIEFTSLSSATIQNQSINLSSITRSGSVATATAASDHGLTSFVPVTITGADQAEYNVIDATIIVTGPNTFTFTVAGTPVTPATGTISAAYTAATVAIESNSYGADTNFDPDTPFTLQTPIVGVDSTLYVDNGAIGGGTDAETDTEYQVRYLEKLQNPVAHFNVSDIETKAKTVSGVTRVWVEEANTVTGTISISSITRNGNVATAQTATPHGLSTGMSVDVSGAGEAEYNVTGARVLVEDTTTFHYIVTGSPSTPATGVISGTTAISLGQVQIYFMRDNDTNPIPSASEVAAVKTVLDTIRPANTASVDLMVDAPTANPIDYVFTELSPNTATMQAAIEANLIQFHEEQTEVGVDDDSKAYEAAIKNTVDTETGEIVRSFTLSAPTGDLTNGPGEISTFGTVTFP